MDGRVTTYCRESDPHGVDEWDADEDADELD